MQQCSMHEGMVAVLWFKDDGQWFQHCSSGSPAGLGSPDFALVWWECIHLFFFDNAGIWPALFAVNCKWHPLRHLPHLYMCTMTFPWRNKKHTQRHMHMHMHTCICACTCNTHTCNTCMHMLHTYIDALVMVCLVCCFVLVNIECVIVDCCLPLWCMLFAVCLLFTAWQYWMCHWGLLLACHFVVVWAHEEQCQHLSQHVQWCCFVAVNIECVFLQSKHMAWFKT